MVSRKNIKYKTQQDAKRVPHYGIRKLSIGVASVLLGMTVTGIVGHADTEAPVNNSKNVSVDESVSDSNLNGSNQVILQSRQTGSDNPTNIHNIEGGDTENAEGNSVNSDNQYASNMPQNMYVQSAVENNNISNSIQNSQLVTKVYQAQNVNVSLFHDSGHDGSVKSIRTGIEDFIGCNTDFQVDLTGAKIGDQVTIGNVNQLTSSGRFMKVRSGAAQLVTYQGKTIGQLMVDTSGKYSSRLYMQLTDIPRDSGVVHIHTHSDLLLVVWANAFDFHGLSGSSLNTFSFVNSDGSKSSLSYSVIKSNLTYADEHKDFYDDLFGSKAWLSTAQFSSEKGHIIFYTSSPEFSQQLLQQAILSNNVSSPLPLLTQNFEYGIKLSNSDGLLPNIDSANSTMFFKYPVVVNGRYVDQTRSGFMVTGLSYNLSLKNIRMADGLSFQQLKALLDPAKSELLYSVQDSKTILLAFNINAKDFKTKEDLAAIKRDLSGMSAAVNASNDPNASAEESAKAILNVLQGYPLRTEMWTVFHWADPTTKSVVNTQLIDLNSGKVILQASASDTYNPPSSQVEGHSTVKLHFVNSNTGTDLAQVKAYTDWPNQGKHVQLSIPTITGYHLETNAPQSVLTKFGLKGTALTTNSAVDYPAEDTISDYYFVMAPNDETATVNIVDADEGNKVLSTGTITGKFGQVVSLSSNLQSKLGTLMATGHYVESANDLDGEVTYGDGASKVYTIKLKHKLDSVQRHYRVIEDLPDGSQKVILDVNATLYKDSNVNYYGERGAYVNGDGTKALLKSNNVSISTGYVVPGDPSGDSLQSMLIDNVPGYSWSFVDQTYGFDHGVQARLNTTSQLALLDIFNGTTGLVYNDFKRSAAAIDPLASRDFHITYSRRSYLVTVNYYDLSGKLVNSTTSMHKFGDTVSIAPVAPTNYVLVSGQAKTDYLMRSGLNEVDFLVEPKVTQITETKTVSRNIKVQMPDGQTQNVVQTVTFARNSYLNQVTKQTTYSPWSFGGQYQFSGYLPKPMAGYTVDVIPAVIVTPDSLNTTVNVTYHKIPVVYEIDYQLANGTVVKNVFMTPERDGTIHLTAPQGYRLLTPVTDVQVGHNSQKLTVLVLPDEQTYTSYSALPSSVTEPLTKTITRTINITMPNGRVRRIVQQVHFVRTATVAANGKITYSNWTGVGQMSFDRLFVPKRRGYRLVMTDNQDQTLIGVNQMVVDPTMNDAVINVKYVK